jgi:cytochrome c oxidase subunit IV
MFKELNEYNSNAVSIEHRERSIKTYFYLCSIIASISNIAFFPIDVFSNLGNQRVTFIIRFIAFLALIANMG